jgi:hypothetical protein
MLTDNVLDITSGIDKINFQKVVKLTKMEFDNLKKGNFPDDDLEKVKKYALNSIRYSEDFPEV